MKKQRTKTIEKNYTDNHGDNRVSMSHPTAILLALTIFIVGFIGGAAAAIFKQVNSSPADVSGNSKPLSENTKIMTQAMEDEVSRNPADVEAWIRLGNAYFDNDQHEKSIRAYQKALAIKPDNPDVLTDMGVMYRLSGQPHKALESFSKAMSVNPKHEVSRLNKGIVLLHDLKDEKGAVQAWEELLKINPMAMYSDGQSIAELVRTLKVKASN